MIQRGNAQSSGILNFVEITDRLFVAFLLQSELDQASQNSIRRNILAGSFVALKSLALFIFSFQNTTAKEEILGRFKILLIERWPFEHRLERFFLLYLLRYRRIPALNGSLASASFPRNQREQRQNDADLAQRSSQNGMFHRKILVVSGLPLGKMAINKWYKMGKPGSGTPDPTAKPTGWKHRFRKFQNSTSLWENRKFLSAEKGGQA